MAHPWSRTLEMLWDDAIDYSEASAGPSAAAPHATLPAQPESGRLFGTVNNLLSRLGPIVNACTISPTRSGFCYKVLNDTDEASDFDDPMDITTHDTTLPPGRLTYTNETNDENVDTNPGYDYDVLDGRTSGRSGRCLPTLPQGSRPSLVCMPTLGDRIASLQANLLPTPTSSSVTTRQPPTPAPHQYNTPDLPTNDVTSLPAVIQEVQHAESKRRHRLQARDSTSRDHQGGKTEYLSPAAQRRLVRFADPAARSGRTINNTDDTIAVQTDPFLDTPPPSTTSSPSVTPPLAATPALHFKIVLTPPPSSDELSMSMPTPAPEAIKLTIDMCSPKKTSLLSPRRTPSPLKGPSLSRKRRREEGQYPALLFMP